MSWLSSLAHKVFPNDPHVVANSIRNGAIRGAGVGFVTGEVAGMGVGGFPAAVGGAILGAESGAITGAIRYGIGVALWGRGH